ncbi:hypothetical protein T02_12020 [Trichinella nativa]|uniref:Uncharacterized protein n=1 Tax=Trichinella nativa TaxID=6335 RepID=A0A0V1KXX2_9BILA|nr:hypothetical protein T02_12020 [Trichinella nativa]
MKSDVSIQQLCLVGSSTLVGRLLKLTTASYHCVFTSSLLCFVAKGKNSNDETQPPMPIALQYPDLKCSPTSVSELLVVVFL